MAPSNFPSATKNEIGYATISLETTRVPLNVSKTGETLSLATLQSAIPGAYGLYFRDESGYKTALKYDTLTGSFTEPASGWKSCQLYVHLAYDSPRNTGNTTLKNYEYATENFKKSVEMVQKMIDSTKKMDEDYCLKKYLRKNVNYQKQNSKLGRLAVIQPVLSNSVENLRNLDSKFELSPTESMKKVRFGEDDSENDYFNKDEQNNLTQNGQITKGVSHKKYEVTNLESEIAKLKEKLQNVNEEKNYYKKQHHSPRYENNNQLVYSNTTMNGTLNQHDDFGRELMLLNKHKYQLESKVRQLEHDLNEALNHVQHLDRNLKNSEKLLWLEKERSATLEKEQSLLNDEVNTLRCQNDELNNCKKSIPNTDMLNQLTDAFIIRKKTNLDRSRWNLLTWENTLSRNVSLKSVYLEVNANEYENVFLIGSFLNWECAIMCEKSAKNPLKVGCWIDLPPGHHQFRFIKSGKWQTAADYGHICNEFGEANNWINVD